MGLAPPWSKNLRRHGDSQYVVQWMMLAISIMFWIAAVVTSVPVMEADTYGVWVTSFPAEVWAGSIMLASFVYLLGIIINGEWRWSTVLRCIGAVWHVLTLAAFCLEAWGTAHGNPVVMMSTGALGVHVWFAALNMGDLWRAIEAGRD